MVQSVIRIRTRYKLYTDDYVLIFGLICLGAATCLVFTSSRSIFLYSAIRIKPKIIPTIGELMQVQNAMKIIHSYHAIIWTTTFSVKLSFLIFFKRFIDRVSRRITIYLWTVAALTVVSWIFIISESIIVCLHFGSDGGGSFLSCFGCHEAKCADVCL